MHNLCVRVCNSVHQRYILHAFALLQLLSDNVAYAIYCHYFVWKVVWEQRNVQYGRWSTLLCMAASCICNDES